MRRIGHALVQVAGGLMRGHGWLLLPLLALLVGLRIADWRPFALTRDNLFDWYQTIAPPAPSSNRVVVVEIDEASLAALGQWPWSRAVLAELTKRLTEAGAIVGFDMVFAEPDRLSPDRLAAVLPHLDPAVARALAVEPNTDRLFAQAIAGGRVVLGQGFEAPGAPPLRSVATIALSRRSADAFLEPHRGLVNPLPVLAQAAAGSGFFKAGVQTEDGVVRHLLTLAMVQDHVVPSLALELARVAQATDDVTVKVSPFGISGLTFGGIAVPTGRASEIWPNFSTAAPRTLSAIAVLDRSAAAESLAGRIAIVGASAVGLMDVQQTPIGRMPGVYLHARAVDNMLSGNLLWRPPWYKPLEIALMIAGGLIVVVAAGFFGRRVVVAAWLTMIVLGFGGSYALFAIGRLLIDPSAAVIAATALVFVILLIGALRQDRPAPAIAR